MTPNGSQNRESSEACPENEHRESRGFTPGDVALRIFGTNTEGAAGQQSRESCTEVQRQLIISAGLLSLLTFPASPDAKGTEHVVRFRGKHVEKHQHSDGWMPTIATNGMLSLVKATPIEYLRRLELQNELFGDQIRIIGLTRANRFVLTQPTLRGGEPQENEIRDVLEEGGWQRVPMVMQDLPSQLMGSAWWHDQEELVLLDARKPNFKKTAHGVLPIDLIIGELSAQMLERILKCSQR